MKLELDPVHRVRLLADAQWPNVGSLVVFSLDRVIGSWDDAVLARLATLDRRVWNERDVDEHLIDYLRRNQHDVLRPERGIPD